MDKAQYEACIQALPTDPKDRFKPNGKAPPISTAACHRVMAERAPNLRATVR